MGFQSMPAAQRKAIAAMGGKANVHRYKWTSEAAREAGKKSRHGADDKPRKASTKKTRGNKACRTK